MKKKLIVTILALVLILTLTACGGGEEEGKKLTIAYQGGIGYAPVHVMEQQGLIQKHCGSDITVEFVKLDSGAAINEGIIGGTIDIGCMGLSPAISGVSAGIPYKAISNLCSQSHGLMSNDASIASLADIAGEDKIALVSTGSIQHILLAMAAEESLGDPHALDLNIQKMSHAEGMAALESGTVQLHLTSSPYIYQERENAAYVELPEIRQVWPRGNTFLVAMASTKLEQDPELFAAVSAAFAEAIDFVATQPDAAADIEMGYLGLSKETILSYLAEEDCQFFPELRGAETMASFMHRAGFIQNPITMEDFKFAAVQGN